MAKFSSLSDIQKSNFRSMSGYEFSGKHMTSGFSTDRPYDSDDWQLSAWYFSFNFDEETGFLYCELSHRMTNNRTDGWDQDGNELARDLIETIYPSHF